MRNAIKLGDRVFPNWQGHGPGQLDIGATADDIAWAAFRLGQYVAGTSHEGMPFRAYIYNVSRLAGAELGTINVLVES